jgi:hypothetical protein
MKCAVHVTSLSESVRADTPVCTGIIYTDKTLVPFQQAPVLIILAATTVFWQLGKTTFEENRRSENSVFPGRFAVSSGE